MVLETIKHDIEQAMQGRGAGAAMRISDNIRSALDLLDEQPADALETMIERAKEVHRLGNPPKHRQKLRGAFIEYAEERLRDARSRERGLAQAITGSPSD